MTADNLSRRLEVLEVVLGIDSDVVCHGSSGGCPQCAETCPLKSNNVQAFSRLLNRALDELLLVRCWAEELESTGAVPVGSWDRAGLRLRLLQVGAQIQHKEELLVHLGSVDRDRMSSHLRQQLTELHQEQGRLQQSLNRARK